MAQNGSESAQGPVQSDREHTHRPAAQPIKIKNQSRSTAQPSSNQDQHKPKDKTDIGDIYMQDTPKPTNTKQAAKRKKHTFGPRPASMRKPNPIRLIYRKGTDCTVADEATEKRLSTTGPSTSTRLAGYNILW